LNYRGVTADERSKSISKEAAGGSIPRPPRAEAKRIGNKRKRKHSKLWGGLQGARIGKTRKAISARARMHCTP